jgi:hypothetical protein
MDDPYVFSNGCNYKNPTCNNCDIRGLEEAKKSSFRSLKILVTVRTLNFSMIFKLINSIIKPYKVSISYFVCPILVYVKNT